VLQEHTVLLLPLPERQGEEVPEQQELALVLALQSVPVFQQPELVQVVLLQLVLL
jgi:hypothetical protein